MQQQTNGYVMRGVDITQTIHTVLSNNFNCIDLGVTCADLSANMTNSYPFIGTTLTSMQVNLTTPASDALTFNTSPTANDGSVTLNGVDQWAQFAILGSSLPTGTSAMSMAIFFKFSANQDGTILSEGLNSGTGTRFGIFYQSGTLQAEASGENATANWTWNNNWHLMVITKPANGKPVDFVMYLDGSAMSIASTTGTTAVNIGSGSGNLSIGRRPAFNGSYFKGTVKGAFVWGRQITAGEVTQLWNSLKYLVGL